jgi:hypothetical protein
MPGCERVVSGRILGSMTFLQKLRARREVWRRGREEKKAEQLAAEARGEAHTLGGYKGTVKPPVGGHEPPP